MNSGDLLARLQRWCLAPCNGGWEHPSGIRIKTVDNPGWRRKINLNGTKAESKSLDHTKIERAEHGWIVYWVEKQQVNSACGPLNLSEVMEAFINWFQRSNHTQESE